MICCVFEGAGEKTGESRSINARGKRGAAVVARVDPCIAQTGALGERKAEGVPRAQAMAGGTSPTHGVVLREGCNHGGIFTEKDSVCVVAGGGCC